MSNISLGAGIRSNLLTLQQNTNAFNTVNSRLSTGRSVNSAVDNPTNYFADVNLKDRASGLRDRLDAMGQSIQRIQAADAGITRVRSVISQMKGVVNDAIGQTDADQREALGRQFNSLIVQMGELVKDSSYAGSNLLSGLETDSVQFSESFDDSKLDVLGFNIQRAGADGDASAFRMDADGNLTAASTEGAVLDGNGSVTDLAAGSGFAIFITTQYTGTGAGAGDIAGIRSAGDGAGAHEIDWTGSTYKDDLANLIKDIEDFDNVLKAEAGALANNLAIITNREEFTNDMVNTLEEGGDKLVLADLNEEAANLLALQTANQLGTQALSLANQQSQSVLQLLG
ncbi:MAG: flagellin [Opitutales bacterium]|nr:flagellin [Opitutales bacterium]